MLQFRRFERVQFVHLQLPREESRLEDAILFAQRLVDGGLAFPAESVSPFEQGFVLFDLRVESLFASRLEFGQLINFEILIPVAAFAQAVVVRGPLKRLHVIIEEQNVLSYSLPLAIFVLVTGG